MLCTVPMDLDVNMKAVLLGGVFLVVSKFVFRSDLIIKCFSLIT